MNNLQIMDVYQNRFLNYAGISLHNRFHFFHVSQDMNYENDISMDAQAGILRFDITNQHYVFAAYTAPICFESYTPGKSVIHIASLYWHHHQAKLTIYAFDCTTMQENEVYCHHFIDDIAEDIETSPLWRLELYSLDDHHIVIKVPDLDPFSTKKNYGFSECILIDLNEQQSFTIPSYLNESDSLLNLSHIERHTWNEMDFLIISTGRTSLNNKRESWNQREHESYNTIKHQTKIVIPLEQWITTIKADQRLEDHYIVDECDFSTGYAQVAYVNNRIYFLKTHFATGSSEIIHYEMSSQAKHSLHFTIEFEKILINKEYAIGVVLDQSFKRIYNLNSASLIQSIDKEHTLEFFNDKLVIIKYVDEHGNQHMKYYNPKTNEMIQHVTGLRIVLFIASIQNDHPYFLVHIKHI